MAQRMNFSVSSTPIASILNNIKTVAFGGLDLQPVYQRGYIWKNDFKDKLIYSIIKAYPIGNISVRVLGKDDFNAKGAKTEVVDGQQRLTTIRDFIVGDYNIKSEWSRKIILEIKEYFDNAKVSDDKLNKLVKKLNNKGHILLKFKDLPEVIQGNINNYNISMSYIADASEIQIREYFRFLQNQERLRAGEIINSMPPTALEEYLNLINDKDVFLDIIGFADDRKEFDKLFYSIIGLFDEKISFGTTDKSIQDYAVNAKGITIGLTNTNNMIEQINSITMQNKSILPTTRKRFIKFLLLLAGFNLVDFRKDCKEKLNELYKIDNSFSAFFSAKANVIEKEYTGYNDKVIDEFRFIALITKGGHSLLRVKNRMEMLAYYVNNPGQKHQPSNVIPIEIA